MKKTFILLALLFVSHISNAQWKWQNPLPAGNTLRSVYFTDTLHGWAVGDAGTIMHYNGSQWVNQSTGICNLLWAVSFTDTLHGWAVGEDGVILKYNGVNWSQEISPTHQFLLDVAFIDNTHGWAVGDSGTILKYNGTTWVQQQSPTTNILRSLSFVDQNLGWATGSSVLKYANSTWLNTQFIQSSSLDFYKVFFTDSLTGWGLVGNTLWGYSNIVKYRNDTNWISGYTNSVTASDLFFLDSLNGWVACGGGVLHYSNHNWQYQTSNLFNNITSIFFTDTLHGWAVGYNGAILKYKNHIWQNDFIDFTNNTSFNAVHITGSANAQFGWAIGSSGAAFNYNPSGWFLNNSGLTLGTLYSVFTLDQSHAWAGGSNGIFKYENNTWFVDTSSTYPSFQFSHVNSFSFTDNMHGWAVCSSGHILKYNGNYWSILADSLGILNSIFFVDSMHGWAVGNSKIIKIENNLVTEFPINTPLHSVTFVNASNGWAVGDSGRIYHYDGSSWILQHLIPDQHLTSVCFTDINHGWAIGYTYENTIFRGIIIKYDGNNWIDECPNISLPLYCISFSDPLNGWIVGGSGTIMHTSDGGQTFIKEPNTTEHSFTSTIFPNPTGDETTIQYTLVHDCLIDIEIFDITGNRISVIQNTYQSPGLHEVKFSTSKMHEGIYLYRIIEGESIDTGKFLVVK